MNRVVELAAAQGSRERILQMHAELQARYPAMPCVAIADEPSHDWGVAHFWGINAEGCAALTFDDAYVPARWVVAHELGHALHAGAGGTPFYMSADDPVLAGYWRAFGYATPLETAIAWAVDVERRDGGVAAHPLYPVEHFADALALLTVGAFGDAQWSFFGGVPGPGALVRLDTFFRSLRPATFGGAPLDIHEVEGIASRVAQQHIAEYAARLQPELEANAYGPIAELQRRTAGAAAALEGAA